MGKIIIIKNKLLLIFLLLCIFTTISAGIQFGEYENNDGPYIFIENDNYIAKYIVGGKKFEKTTKTKKIKIPELCFEIELFEPEIVEPAIYKSDEFYVISDIHGQFELFVKLLQVNNIIDNNNNWNFNRGTLVILGDVFDRGPQVTECLWLIYKLESQAKKHDGKVIFILGNHEIMVLQGDLRYLHDKYSEMTEPLLGKMNKLYSNKTVLGKWLRSKNTLIKLNDNLLVHAGISPEIIENQLQLMKINQLVKENIDQTNSEEMEKLVFHSNGPFWFRGYFQKSKEYSHINENELFAIMKYYDIQKIIVGHTTFDSISTFYNGKVIAVDSGIKTGETGEMLYWNNNKYFRVNEKGQKKLITE